MVSKKAPHSGYKLPAGWALKFHVSKSGAMFKYYENSKIGQKFFNKDDITRYIKMFGDLQPNMGPISRVTENGKMHNSKEATNGDLEWLPHGWVIQDRTIKSGPKCGQIYKNYVDQSSGRKFFSKVGVLRFLEAVKQESCLFEQKIKRATKCATEEVVIETSTEEDLPPGWIKELKIKKLNGRIRRDPFYTDPETGYVFRSKRDVQRYLETGEISRHAFLPQKRHINDETLLALAKCEQPIHDVNKKDPHTDADIDAIEGGYNLRWRVTPKVAGTSISSRVKNVTSETTQPTNLAIQKFQKCPSENMVDCAANEKEIVKEGTVKRKKEMITNRKSETTSCHSDKKKGFILPRPQRSSKRLAGLEPEQVSTETSGLEDLPLKQLKIIKNKGKIGEDPVLTETSEAKDLPLGSKKELKIRKNRGQIRENPSASIKCEQPISHDISLRDYTDKHIDACKVRSRTRGSIIPLVVATSEKGSSKSISAETEEIPAEKLPQDSVIDGGSESENVLEEQMVESDEEKKGKKKSKKGSCMSDDKKGLAAPRQLLKHPAGFEAGKVDNSVSNALGIEDVYDSPINKLLIPRASKRINCRKVVSRDVPIVATEAVFGSHDEIVVNVEAAVIQEKDVLESAKIIKGKTNGKESSSKCKTAIEIKYQRRSSNRLAGLSPMPVDNSQPCAQVTKPDFYTKESERRKILALTASSDFEAANANNGMHVETSSNSQLSLIGEAISKEQQDKARTDETDNQISKELIIPQSTNFYSDPCIEFAFKTLTGEIPIENFMDGQLVSTPAADCGDEILHRSRTDESRKKEASVHSSQYNTSRKTVLALRCSRQLFASDSISKFVSAGKTVANGPSQPFKAGFLEYANRKPFNVSTISSILSQRTETGIKEPSPRFFLSFGDCWSDSSVEYALETPTGTIPLKGDPLTDEFSMLHLQQQGSSKNQKGDRLALPDFCIPSSFQNDFLSYFNAPKKPPSPKQQISEQVPPLIPSASASENQKDDRLALPNFCIPSSFQNDVSSCFNFPKKQPSQKSANVSAPPYIILNCQDVRLKGKTVRGRSKS